MSKKIIFSIILIFLTSNAFAIQDLMPFHGTATQSGNNIQGGDVRVQIYDANIGGNLIYDSLTNFNGEIINGQYDIVLGSGTEQLDLNQGTAYYLHLLINGNDMNKGSHDRQRFIANFGNDINLSGGSLTTNGQPRLTILEDGNVGIGDTTPAGSLEVENTSSGADNRAILIHNASNTDESFATIGFSASAADMGTFMPGAISWRRDTGGETGFQFRTGTSGLNPTARMTILDDGNVGIGTTAPAYELEVSGGSAVSALAITTTDMGSDAAILRLKNSAGAFNDVTELTHGAGAFAIRNGTGNESITINQSTQHVGISDTTPNANLEVAGTFMVSATASGNGDVLIIDSDGNVGIGDTTPNNKLKVIGKVVFEGTDATSGNTPFTVGTNGDGSAFRLIGNSTINSRIIMRNNNGNNTIILDTAGTAALPSYIHGRLGIGGDTTPDANLEVAGTFMVSSSDTGNGDQLTVLSDGNVGIGTTTPDVILQIDGNFLPEQDAVWNIGSPSLRWNTIYASNGTIQTSDEKTKQNISDINADGTKALDFIKQLEPKSYQWKSQTLTQKEIDTPAVEEVSHDENQVTQAYVPAVYSDVNTLISDAILDENGLITTPAVYNDVNTLITPAVPEIISLVKVIDTAFVPATYKDVNYIINDDSNHFGFIAQDIVALKTDKQFGGIHYDAKSDTYGLNYAEFIPYLVQGMKEQQAEIDTLKTDMCGLGVLKYC